MWKKCGVCESGRKKLGRQTMCACALPPFFWSAVDSVPVCVRWSCSSAQETREGGPQRVRRVELRGAAPIYGRRNVPRPTLPRIPPPPSQRGKRRCVVPTQHHQTTHRLQLRRARRVEFKVARFVRVGQHAQRQAGCREAAHCGVCVRKRGVWPGRRRPKAVRFPRSRREALKNRVVVVVYFFFGSKPTPPCPCFWASRFLWHTVMVLHSTVKNLGGVEFFKVGPRLSPFTPFPAQTRAPCRRARRAAPRPQTWCPASPPG